MQSPLRIFTEHYFRIDYYGRSECLVKILIFRILMAKENVSAEEKETYFSHPERLFPKLTDENKIPTDQFLSACQGVADFVGKSNFLNRLLKFIKIV